MKKNIISILLLFIVTPIFANDNKEFYRRLVGYMPNTVGMKKFPSINSQKYRGDCSGFIAFLFHLAGVNFLELYGIGTNGVAAIWDGLQKKGFIIEINQLQIGDIIFFDNTYDMNKNNKWDDFLSHIGVVESIDQNNTITYLHYASKGVVRAKMNLQHPEIFNYTSNGNKYRYNDFLRAKGNKKSTSKYLSGSLYRGVARLSLKKNHPNLINNR